MPCLVRHVAADQDVLQRRHVGEEPDVLEGARHAGLGDQVGLGRQHAARRSIDGAGGRHVQPGEAVEEGRLAGAVGPDQADDLAGVHGEVDSSTAVRPPNRMVTCWRRAAACRPDRRGRRRCRWSVVAVTDPSSAHPAVLRAPPTRRLDVVVVMLVELQLPAPVGDQALGAEAHHQDEREAEEPQPLVLEEAQLLRDEVAGSTAPSTARRRCPCRRGRRRRAGRRSCSGRRTESGVTDAVGVGLTVPARPARKAPSAKARSLSRKPLMPMAVAAVSSSRMATQARPIRVSVGADEDEHHEGDQQQHQEVVVGEDGRAGCRRWCWSCRS